jgi:hypothetical protein
MRGGYDVSDPVGNGHLRHLGSFIERLGAIVDGGKNVAMDINH